MDVVPHDFEAILAAGQLPGQMGDDDVELGRDGKEIGGRKGEQGAKGVGGGVEEGLGLQTGCSRRTCLGKGRVMTNRSLALIGAALLFVGVFMPILSVPIMGSVNYFMNGKGDGVIVLLMALAAGGLALAGRVRHVVWPGAVSLVMLAFTFVRFQSGMAEMRSKMDSDLADNPFRGLAEAAMGSIQLQWGWAVLLLGAAIVTYAGIADRRAGGSSDAADQ